MKRPQQLEAHRSILKDSPRSRKENKRSANRGERREAKKDPENAPKKRGYRGYTL